MIDWLVSLPESIIVGGSLLFFGSSALVAWKLFDHTAKSQPSDDHHAVAASLMPGLCAIFGIVASLTMVHQLDGYGDARAAVSQTANAASRLAWATADEAQSDVPKRLTAALTAALNGQWTIRPSDAQAAAVTASLRRLEVAARIDAQRRSTSVAKAAEILAAVDDLSAAHRARLDAESNSLPPLFFIALILAGLAVVFNAVALTIGRPNTRRLIVLLSVLVAVDVAVVVLLWTPFAGSERVSPEPLVSVVQDLRQGSFTLR